MKICIVFNHPAPYKVRLFNELAKKHDIFVVFERKASSGRAKNFYNEEIHFPHIFLKGINVGEENFISNGIKTHLKQNKYDLIIMNGYSTFAEIKAIKYMIKNHIPYSIYVNGGFIHKERTWKKKLKTNLISNAQFYFAPSVEAKKYLTYYGAKEENIYLYTYSTIYENEILTKPLLHDEKVALRKKLDLPTKNIFICVSRFLESKNLTNLIYFFIDYMPKDNNLILLGGGPLMYRYLQIIRKEKAKNIFIFNHLDRNVVFDYLKASDIFLFPTLEDVYGHVVNEAMANGVPVISSDRALASLKLIKNGYNGYIYTSGDKNQLLDDIKTIHKKNHAMNCLKTARENTIEKMIADHDHILEVISKKL